MEDISAQPKQQINALPAKVLGATIAVVGVNQIIKKAISNVTTMYIKIIARHLRIFIALRMLSGISSVSLLQVIDQSQLTN